MKDEKNSPKSASEYFRLLLNNKEQNNLELQESEENQPYYQETQSIEEEAYHQIIYGIVEFKEKPDSIEEIIELPKQKKQAKDIDEIDRKIKENEEMLKKAKIDMLMHKKREKEALKLEHEIKMFENQEKTREWAEKQKIYEKRRQELFERRQREMEEAQEQEKRERERQKEEEIEKRKQALEEHFKSFEEDRQRRKELYEQTIEESKRIPEPKYKLIEKEFEKYLEEEKFEKEIAKKNVKIAKEVNFNLIKEHEKKYLEKLEERMKEKGYSSLKSMREKSEDKEVQESRFKNLLKRSDSDIEEERQKFQRRLSYQTRLSEIDIQTDENKKIKIEIARDKAKNPLKYNFLRQKNLNDYQIFMEFKDFILDIDRNELGKEYLKEAKKIGEESRIRKSQSFSAISTKNQNTNASSRYTNYLPEIKSRRSAENEANKKLLTPRDVEEVAKRVGSKEKALEKISKSLKNYDDSILNKKLQLQSLNMISSTIKKEREIDELYMKSLKAKLACLEISEN